MGEGGCLPVSVSFFKEHEVFNFRLIYKTILIHSNHPQLFYIFFYFFQNGLNWLIY
jgi:hypothetical protein